MQRAIDPKETRARFIETTQHGASKLAAPPKLAVEQKPDAEYRRLMKFEAELEKLCRKYKCKIVGGDPHGGVEVWTKERNWFESYSEIG